MGEVGTFGISGNAVDFTVGTAAPEPSTYAMLMVGLGALCWIARRRTTAGA